MPDTEGAKPRAPMEWYVIEVTCRYCDGSGRDKRTRFLCWNCDSLGVIQSSRLRIIPDTHDPDTHDEEATDV